MDGENDDEDEVSILRNARTLVVGECLSQRRDPQLDLEEVLLVEEEDDVALGEVLAVADLLEQLQRLRHSVLHIRIAYVDAFPTYGIPKIQT